jgi:flagellar biosynthesis/type III secretory pathway protein FliH
MHATAWSLDEFVAHDVFMASTPSVPMPAAELSPEELAADQAAQFEAEVARIQTDAYARGFAEGEQAARDALDAELSSAMRAITSAAQSVQQGEARWIANAEENIAALAVMVARHIVQREVVVDPSFLHEMVTRALAQYPADQELTVRLHPQDLLACRGVLEQPGGTVAGRTIRWMADPSIARGGCLTEGRDRIIDGRVDTALERAYRAIGGILA